MKYPGQPRRIHRPQLPRCQIELALSDPVPMAREQPAELEAADRPSVGSLPPPFQAPAFRPPVAEEPLSIPDYELLRRVGRGAYGEVWLARNLTGSFVAVKVVARAAFDHDRPFEREFEGIKRFEPISRSDPSQVAILHVGRGDGFFYYVMELADDANGRKKDECRMQNDQAARSATPVSSFSLRPSAFEGYAPHTLREDLKQHDHLPAPECVQIGLALTRGLAHLHRNGLVHRDVKPSNVIFVGGVPKLADIGLVTSVDATRSFVGTEGYVAPEGPGAPQADLYSLGKLLYEMSTGCDRKEFPALPPDIAARPDCDALVELNAIVMRACQFDPRERHASADAMRAELALLERGQSVKRQRTVQRRWAAGKKAGVALAALAAVVACGVVLWRSVAPTDPYPDGSPSTNLVAKADCEKGMAIIREDNCKQIEEAFAKFTNAIRLDPNCPKPYVGLMELSLREPVSSWGEAKELDLRWLATKLNQLAPHLGATYVAQAINSFFDWDFPAAERYVKQGIKANPRYELGHTWYGFMLTHWGRCNQARRELDKSLEVSPPKAVIYRAIAHTYYMGRRFAEATNWYGKALLLDTNHSPDFEWMGRALQAMGDYTNALDYLEKGELLISKDKTNTAQHFASLRQALGEHGVSGYWQEKWRLSELEPEKDFYDKAIIQIHVGDTNAALDWLEKTFESQKGRGQENEMMYLLFDESWDGLRDLPRFKRLLGEVGFPKVMAKKAP
jgi:tetratricopeptide (TPR) repeat protein